MIPVPVNIVWDITVGFNTHNQLSPPPIPAPVPIPAIEIVATQMWTAGYLTGKNKFTTTVLSERMPTCLESHDLGPLIPDPTIPPAPNIHYAIHWPFSSRKMVFSANAVKFNGSPVACSAVVPPFAMMTCGDPLTLPNALPVTNWMRTVFVGMTPGDFLAGVVNIGVSVAVDAVFEYVKPFKNLSDAIPASVRRKFGAATGAIVEGVASKLGLTPKSFVKNATNAAAGFGAGTAINAVDSDRPAPAAQLTVGGGPLPSAGIQVGGSSTDDGFHQAGSVGDTPVGGTTSGYGDPLNVFTEPAGG